MNTLPKNARVVIVGGGIVGCSTAYHLARLGWSEIVLLERAKLTSGLDVSRRRPWWASCAQCQHYPASRAIRGLV